MIEIIHLDLNLTEHCNFSCTACSHLSPIHKPWFMPLEMIEHDLVILKSVLKVCNVNLVGGEPTLHPKLIEIMKLVKLIRIDDKTHLITNGSLLPRMSDEFWRELEYMKLSIYGRLDPACVKLAEEKQKEYGFGYEPTEWKEFFLQSDTVPDGSSFHKCPWKSDCFTVHRGHFYLCPQSTFMPKTIMSLPENIDGLPLEGITEEKLSAFMNRTEPLNACQNCRAYGPKIPWSETRGREDWIRESKIKA